MKANEIKIGTILKLKIDNEVRNEVRDYKVTVIFDNQYKIFNKFVTSTFVDLDFINSKLVK
jgi:hypothetical protein